MVKGQLGISASTYDTGIDTFIPIVSSDVRRILNNSFDKYILATFTSGSTEINFGLINQIFYEEGDYFPPRFQLGQVIQGTGIPDDTYLSSIDPVSAIYTMSAAATADGDYVVPTINVYQWPVISKMIWYRYIKQNTTDVSAEKLSSISYGPVSKSFADSEINKKWNYPQILIDDLGSPFQGVR